MKTIIAGTRTFNDYEFLKKTVEESGFEITEIISGGASGVDELGAMFALEKEIPLRVFKADWNNLETDGAIIKTGNWGNKYNAKAGIDRNELMAKYADALIAIHKNNSPGTKSMINLAKKYNLKIFVKEI